MNGITFPYTPKEGEAKIALPSPKLEGVSFSNEKIWSKNTGRVANGDMTGDIVAIKKKISIEFPPLSPAQIDVLESIVSNKNLPFFPLEFNDGKTTITKTVYAGPTSCKLYSWLDGIRYYTGYKIDLVER